MTYDNAHRHSLIIKHVREQDFGAYTCIAKNNLGEAESTLRLTGKVYLNFSFWDQFVIFII